MKKYLKSQPVRKRISHVYILAQRRKALLGVIDLLILHWIKKQPLCGQDIKEKIKEEFALIMGPGTLYPILYQLQRRHLITSQPYQNKKMYFLTEMGKDFSIKSKQDYLKVQKSLVQFFK